MQGKQGSPPAGESLPTWAAPEATPGGPEPGPGVDRPRAFRLGAKVAARGVESLTASELISLLLGGGEERKAARRAADAVLRRRGIRGLSETGFREWLQEPDMRPGDAAAIAAAIELGRRVHGAGGDSERARIARPRDAFELTRDVARARKEHLVGLYLDAQNGLIGRETISIGSLNTTRTHPREILYPAITLLALGFVLVHNHPSGCLEPSEEDIEFTRSVRRAGELMGIELYDHLVVAPNGFTSLRERGVL